MRASSRVDSESAVWKQVTRIRSRTLIYRRLRGKNAHIPKRLQDEDANKYTEKIQAERSSTEGYEAKNLLIYQKRLRGKDARIPQQLRGDPSSYNLKCVENTLPKNTKCQIDKKSRRKQTASFSKAPKTTQYSDPTSWKSSNRRIALGRSPERQSQRTRLSEWTS